jgi:hypothetical protein
MDPIALRPRKATEIVDAAIEVYRRNPIHFLLLAAVVHVPWLIVQIIVLGPRSDEESLIPSLLIGGGTALTTYLLSGFIVHMASEVYLGRDTDAFQTMRTVLPKLPAVFIASLLQSVAIGLGFALFLFPAIWVTAVLFAVLPVIVVEHRGVFAAFDRSQKLSDGVKSHILSAIGLLVIIRVIVGGGSAIVSLLIPMRELRFVALAAAGMLLYPLYGIAATLIYYDIRIRKEGFDIEMMAKAPAAAPDSAAISV